MAGRLRCAATGSSRDWSRVRTRLGPTPGSPYQDRTKRSRKGEPTMQRTFLVTLILVVAGLAGLPVAAHAASYPFHPAGPIRCDSATGTVTAYPSNDVQSWYSTTETVWWSSELVWWNARTQTWDPADLTDWGWLTATTGPRTAPCRRPSIARDRSGSSAPCGRGKTRARWDGLASRLQEPCPRLLLRHPELLLLVVDQAETHRTSLSNYCFLG